MDQSYQSRQMENKNQDRRRNDDKVEPLKADDKKIKMIVVDGSVDTLVEYAEIIGKNLKDLKLTTSQIINIFGTVRQLQMKWDKNPEQSYREAILLIPKLGYYAVREKKSKINKSQGMETFQNIFTPALKYLIETGLTYDQKQNQISQYC